MNWRGVSDEEGRRVRKTTFVTGFSKPVQAEAEQRHRVNFLLHFD